jgi:hypothetical protein
MSSGWRERRLVFLFPGRGALPQGNVSENRTLGYKLKCVSRSKSVSIYICSKHISSTTTTAHTLKKHGALDAPSSVGWIIFPKVLPVSFD